MYGVAAADPARGARIAWVDTAKACGMLLVFVGHVLEQVFAAGNPAALAPFRAVYAFHMPAFFVLAGCVAKAPSGSFASYARAKAATRLVPVLSFNAIAIPLHALAAAGGGSDVWTLLSQQPLGAAALIARGYSLFNALGWFLICLFVVELAHFALSRIASGAWGAALSAAVLGVLGWVAAQPLGAPGSAWAGPLADFWHVRAAIGLAAFHQLGVWLRRSGVLEAARAPLRDAACGAVLGAVVLWAAGANTGPWRVAPALPVVMTNLLQWGDPLAFAIGAVAGSGALIALARAAPPRALVSAVGRRTGVLIGPAGLFFHFANPPLARAVALPDSVAVVCVFALAVGGASLAVSFPFAELCARRVPRWVGVRPPAQ